MDEETKAALLAALEGQREHVLGILEGLSDEALRRPVLPSGWTCLGMVNHLALTVERFWLTGVVGGEPSAVITSDAVNEQIWRAEGLTGDAVFELYRGEIERSNAAIAAADPTGPPAYWPEQMWPDWRLPDLRAVMLHVITETGSHTGHLDAARELIDGRQWMVG